MSHDSQDPSPDAPPSDAVDVPVPAPGALVAMLLTAVTLAAVIALAIEWPEYRTLLFAHAADTPSFGQDLLILWAVWSKTLVLLAPVLLVSAALLRTRWRALAAWVFGAGTVFVCVWILFDLYIHHTYGWHLLTLLPHIGEVAAAENVGGYGRWVASLSGIVVATSAAMLAIWWVWRRGVRGAPRLAGLLSTPRRAAVTTLAVALMTLAPVGLRNYVGQAMLYERACEIMPVDMRIVTRGVAPTHLSDPVLVAIDTRARDVVERLPADARVPDPPLTITPADRAGPHPDVLMIVCESLNADIAYHHAMPRLAAMATDWMRFDRHYAGSNHTDAGLFALLHGGSAIVRAPLLAQGLPPNACGVFRSLGYETAYVSGVRWEKIDDFVNARTFDRYVHDLPGRRAGRDEHAMRRVVEMLNEPHDRPRLVVVFLESSHYPYTAPESYAATPVPGLNPADYGADAFSPGLRKYVEDYHRTLMYLDELIAGAVGRLNLSRSIVLVTGDHAEALGHDGTVGHGTRFSDAQCRVPLYIGGVGVPLRHVESLTTHQDVLPTVLHAVLGRDVSLAGTDGRDLLSTQPVADEALLYATINETCNLVLMRGDDRLAFKVDLAARRIACRGFYSPTWRYLPDHGQKMADVNGWVDLLDRRLRTLLASGAATP
ncbi:MAG: sulfatase-like hydrolase/transferase [Phycisphaera sp.]|nr:sulfatase-like hydrolase/transferase [Phycisphaera sp.]